MGLTMSQRRAVSKVIATRYKRADKAAKGVILDELCATTGWHRKHARKALTAALRPTVVGPTRKARVPKYDEDTVAVSTQLGPTGTGRSWPHLTVLAIALPAADEYVDRVLLDQQAERMASRISKDIEGFALVDTTARQRHESASRPWRRLRLRRTARRVRTGRTRPAPAACL